MSLVTLSKETGQHNAPLKIVLKVVYFFKPYVILMDENK